MKKQTKVIVGFILVAIIVIFSAINTKKVAVNFGFSVVQSPLIFIILGAAFLGGLIVLVTWFSSYWAQRQELKKLRKEAGQFEKRLSEEVATAVANEREIWQAKIDQLDTELVTEDSLNEPEIIEEVTEKEETEE